MKKIKALLNRNKEKGIREIKLRELLELIDEKDITKEIKTMFPPIEIGSITLVDQIVILSIIDLIKPKKILEIGTYQGYTTRIMLRNSDAEKITSIDLPKDYISDRVLNNKEKILTDGNYNDEYLKTIQKNSGEVYLRGLNKTEKSKLKLIKEDSKTVDFAKKVGNINFAFIDGGHDYMTIENDTKKTLEQMNEGVIVWHDYNSAIHSDVTTFLKNHSRSRTVFHVLGSLCAFEII